MSEENQKIIFISIRLANNIEYFEEVNFLDHTDPLSEDYCCGSLSWCDCGDGWYEDKHKYDYRPNKETALTVVSQGRNDDPDVLAFKTKELKRIAREEARRFNLERETRKEKKPLTPLAHHGSIDDLKIAA